jgi:type IV pilus assembly protein PilA
LCYYNIDLQNKFSDYNNSGPEHYIYKPKKYEKNKIYLRRKNTMLKKLYSMKNKKGFTLVEIIVVLVILAILAAAGIPTLIGFVDESRGKAYVAEARAAWVAVQAVATEIIVGGDPISISNVAATTDSIKDHNNQQLSKMLAPDIDVASVTGIKVMVSGGTATGEVQFLRYASADGRYFVLLEKGKSARVSKTSPSIPSY